MVRPLALPAVLLLALPALFGCSGDSTGATGENLLKERTQVAVTPPLLAAASRQAEADGDTHRIDVLERLSSTPTGIWLTPERLPTDQVGDYVASVVADAGDDQVPVFVLYGIPDRDCTAGFSAGGLTADTYLPWVQAIADAPDPSIAILEPDALAATASASCVDSETRIGLLRDAAAALTEGGVTTYLDAGHSDWIPAADMADLLRETGVASVRGFATDVANYQPLSRELAYANELSGLLDGAHYVIDTGRNGDPSGTGQPVKDWCNPPGQALGRDPGFVDDGTPLDALLWIKPPVESDGPCHDGPPAGDVWMTRALELADAAGW